MKKLFLLFAASALVFSVSAQKPAINPIPQKANRIIKAEKSVDGFTSNNAPKPLGSNSKSISPVYVGSSLNAYSALIAQSNMASYEPVSGLMSHAHRGRTAATSGKIFNSVSTNGTTWDTTQVAYDNSTYSPARYPSGTLFNPIGNTDINNVYSIVCGPGLNATGAGFASTYIGWKKQNAPAKSFVEFHNNAKRLDRFFLNVTPSGKIFFNGTAHVDDGTNYTEWHHTLISAQLDVTTDTLTSYDVTVIAPPFYVATIGALGEGMSDAGVAFNKAGTVGYYVFIGIRGDVATPLSNTSYRPIVYKTIDEGATWNIQPDFDFGTIPAFNEVLPGTAADTTIIIPFFRGIDDLVVDANDNLHLVSYVAGQSSTHPDSLGYTWNYASIEGIMYDTYMTPTGWDAIIIDLQNTLDHDAADGNDLLIENRLQMGISDDGKKIFYTWADSDPAMDANNVLPDLYATGRHIDSANVAEKMNITAGTTLEYGATYQTMAPQVKEVGNVYTLYTIVTQLGEVVANDPANYYFMNDVLYTFEGTSVNNLDKNVANISNLYPNPTNGLTNVDLSLVNSSVVSIQVVNMMGQVVSSQDCGYKATGMHKLTINASDLTSGIYFVTVKAGNSTSTSKMIVR